VRVSFTDLPAYAHHVLVDGAFDPLHAGHLAYLNAARQLHRGPLLCAVASDQQIREKGREPLLPQESRVAVMEALCDAVYAKDRPTEAVIEKMAPAVYVKGADWQGQLPPEQESACLRIGTEIVFLPTLEDSSTERLRAWALKDADASLDRLTAYMAQQAAISSTRFNTEYFTGAWRDAGSVYTLESRREIEGAHPRILAETFPRMSMLDVGCGPGFLVTLLKELGVDAGGCDPSYDAVKLAGSRTVVQMHARNVPSRMSDVVICREVLEHVTVGEVVELVADLFRIARKAVYITTRFHQGSIFDVTDDRETDPTHQTLLTQPHLRALCVLNGGTRRRDWEEKLDHMGKGRVLCYEV
jgi:glycerol-3-phosphate cytidylyltransferase